MPKASESVSHCQNRTLQIHNLNCTYPFTASHKQMILDSFDEFKSIINIYDPT